jgi:hypothetical protein
MGRVVMEDGVARMRGKFDVYTHMCAQPKEAGTADQGQRQKKPHHQQPHLQEDKLATADKFVKEGCSNLRTKSNDRMFESRRMFHCPPKFNEVKKCALHAGPSSTGAWQAAAGGALVASTETTYMCELVVDDKIQELPVKASNLSVLPGKPSNSSLPNSSLPDLAPQSCRESCREQTTTTRTPGKAGKSRPGRSERWFVSLTRLLTRWQISAC